MGPYSHYFLAARLEPIARPDHRSDYYWGAVAPDIRYLAHMQRDRTHLPMERIKALMACYPHLHSFLLGYQVHLLIDQIDLAQVISAAFPLKLIQLVRRKRPSNRQTRMAVEMYYLRAGAVGEALSGEYNEVLADLGISAEQARQFHQSLQAYFDTRSSEVALTTFQELGMIEDTRIQKYVSAYRSMQKYLALYRLFELSIKNARLDSKVMAYVRANLI